MALENYRTVAERLSQYWKEHPDGRIVTTLLSGESNYWIFRAEVFRHRDDENPVSTGHAHEVIGATHINKTSALEVCESSAVGRALAIYLYQGQQIASVEEIERAQTRQKEQSKTPLKPAPITDIAIKQKLDDESQIFYDQIIEAKSLEELNNIGQEIADRKYLTPSSRAHLRAIFGQKRIELTQ